MLTISEKSILNEQDILDWEELWDRLENSHFFNSYQWFLACKDGLQQNLKVWFAYYESSLVGIFPLCKIRKFGITCWGIIGRPYADKCSILFDIEYNDYLEQFLHEIGNTTPIVLEEVPDSWEMGGNDYLLYGLSSINPYVKLDEDVLSQVKRKEWNNIRRKAEKSDLIFKVHSNEDVCKNIHILWEIESQSNKPSKNRAMFETDKVKKLFDIVSNSNKSVLFVLYDGERPIAHMFGYNIKNLVFHAHHMSYSQEYFKQTPGKIVIYWLICYLQEKGFKVFDFSRGETMLKKHFSSYRETNYEYYYNCSMLFRIWFKSCLWIKEKYYDTRHCIKKWYLSIKGRGRS